MSRSIFLLFCLSVLSGCRDKSESVEIELRTSVDFPDFNKVVLYELSREGFIPVDTLNRIDGLFKGSVRFKGPGFYAVAASGFFNINLIIDKQVDRILIDHSLEKLNIKGSRGSEIILQIDNLIANAKRKLRDMTDAIARAQLAEDFSEIDNLNNRMNDLKLQTVADLKDIISSSRDNDLAVLYGMKYLNFDSDYSFIDQIVSSLDSSEFNHFWYDEFRVKLDETRKLQIGKMAPSFELIDSLGNSVSITDFRGTFVLVDFWASWCRPCRDENPHLLNLFQQFQARGFTILGISLDREKNALYKAVREDGLTWLNLHDEGGEVSQVYKVEFIPANYLIDPQGTIIAKDLRGAALQNKLAEIFGK